MDPELDTSLDTVQAEPEKSLRDEIAGALAEHVPADTTEQADLVDPPATGRDPKGRFAGKQTEQVTETPPVVEEFKAPEAWKPEAKEAIWKDLTPAAKKYITDREAEVHKGFTKFDEERQIGRQMRDIISPYLPLIRSQGGDPATAVTNLLQTAHLLATAPKEQKAVMIRQLAQQHGVLEDLAQPAQYVDPQVSQLQTQLRQLQQESALQKQQREQQEQSQLTQTVEAFAADPAHQHFEKVRAHMGALLQGGVAKDMQDAYEQAIWARPDLRETLLTEQKLQQQTNTQEAARERAAQARRASGSVTGSPGVVVPNQAPANRSLREELQASFRQVAGQI